MLSKWFAIGQKEWQELCASIPWLSAISALLRERSEKERLFGEIKLASFEEQGRIWPRLEAAIKEQNAGVLKVLASARKEIETALAAGKVPDKVTAARVLHELENEHFWKEWRRLLSEQMLFFEAYGHNPWLLKQHRSKLTKYLHDEERLLGMFRHLTKAQGFSDLHAHGSNTMTPEQAWQWFLETGYALDWVAMREEPGIWYGNYAPEDARALNVLAEETKESMLPEHELFIRFLMILQQERDAGNERFLFFQAKSDLIYAMHQKHLFDAKGPVAIERYAKMIEGMLRSCEHEGVDYLELRTAPPCRELFEGIRAAQMRVPNVTMKYIDFMPYKHGDPDALRKKKLEIDKLFGYRLQYPFIVGVDIVESAAPEVNISHDLIEYVGDLNKKTRQPLLITTHQGEMFHPRNWDSPLSKIEVFGHILDRVEGAVDHYWCGVRRLGHANILGIDVNEYFKEELAGGMSVRRRIEELAGQQDRILEKILRYGIAIETNPTSNLMIAGIEYERATAVQLIKKAERLRRERNIAKPILVTINTDDRIQFGGRLLQEFLRVGYEAGLSAAEVNEIKENATKARLDQM